MTAKPSSQIFTLDIPVLFFPRLVGVPTFYSCPLCFVLPFILPDTTMILSLLISTLNQTIFTHLIDSFVSSIRWACTYLRFKPSYYTYIIFSLPDSYIPIEFWSVNCRLYFSWLIAWRWTSELWGEPDLRARDRVGENEGWNLEFEEEEEKPEQDSHPEKPAWTSSRAITTNKQIDTSMPRAISYSDVLAFSAEIISGEKQWTQNFSSQ